MMNIAAAVEDIRRKVRVSPLSIRELARRARCSDSTIRDFLESGNAQVATLERIEEAVSAVPQSSIGIHNAQT